MRESKYTAIIIKKQAFNEADEIITFFSKEQGKIRALAKSVKLPKSKLANSLQLLFLCEVTLVGGERLPKISGVEAKRAFMSMRHNLALLKHSLYATELVLKFTGDEQKNEQLFNLLVDFFQYLDKTGQKLDLGLAKFKNEFLNSVGLSPAAHGELESSQKQQCLSLEKMAFDDVETASSIGDVEPLQKFLSQFIAYNLEREVKSERFLSDMI